MISKLKTSCDYCKTRANETIVPSEIDFKYTQVFCTQMYGKIRAARAIPSSEMNLTSISMLKLVNRRLLNFIRIWPLHINKNSIFFPLP